MNNKNQPLNSGFFKPDKNSETWKFIEQQALLKIEECQRVLERPKTDWEKTIAVRAYIKAIRELLEITENKNA